MNKAVRYIPAIIKTHLKTFVEILIFFVVVSNATFAFLLSGVFSNLRELTRYFASQIQAIIANNHNTNTSKVVAIRFRSVEKPFPGTFFIISIDGNVNTNAIVTTIQIWTTLVTILLFFSFLAIHIIISL